MGGKVRVYEVGINDGVGQGVWVVLVSGMSCFVRRR